MVASTRRHLAPLAATENKALNGARTREEAMSDTIPSPANQPLEQPSRIADATPEQLAEQRYLTAVGKLVDDAAEHGYVGVLADTLAWTIARLIVGCGVAAAG